MLRFVPLLFSGLLAMAPLTEGTVAPSAGADRQAFRAKTGVAVTPKNFPANTAADIDDAFRIAAQLGDYAVFIYQWHELNAQIAKAMVDKSRQAGLIPIIGLSPTTLDQGRKELDLPAAVRRRAGARVSFANPVIRRAYTDAALELARLRPPYLCLATEINLLALQHLDEYLFFATLYKETYAKVKQVAPDTKVFVSFQWEWMRIVDAKEPLRIGEHRKVIDIFRPQLDVIGLTTYPSPFHQTPEDLPGDYYSWIYRHIQNTDEVVLMEVGWPTGGSGSEQEQARFIRRLPELLRPVNVSVIAWALLHDVAASQFDANLNTVGLITRGGSKKPGYYAFQRLSR
jgi:hypothetical protein